VRRILPKRKDVRPLIGGAIVEKVLTKNGTWASEIRAQLDPEFQPQGANTVRSCAREMQRPKPLL
jgi:hypothetical protein